MTHDEYEAKAIEFAKSICQQDSFSFSYKYSNVLVGNGQCISHTFRESSTNSDEQHKFLIKLEHGTGKIIEFYFTKESYEHYIGSQLTYNEEYSCNQESFESAIGYSFFDDGDLIPDSYYTSFSKTWPRHMNKVINTKILTIREYSELLDVYDFWDPSLGVSGTTKHYVNRNNTHNTPYEQSVHASYENCPESIRHLMSGYEYKSDITSWKITMEVAKVEVVNEELIG